jgi:hypothetical protein
VGAVTREQRLCVRPRSGRGLESDRATLAENEARLAPRGRRCGRIVRAVRASFLAYFPPVGGKQLLSRSASLYDALQEVAA